MINSILHATDILKSDRVFVKIVKDNKMNKKNRLVLYYKFFWVIVILPKSVQLFVLGWLVLYALNYREFKMSRATLFFLAGLLVQLSAILLRMIASNPEISRIFAAFNTWGVWLIGIAFYELFRSGRFSENDLSQLQNYAIINLAIFVLIFIFSLFYKQNFINIFGYRLQLRASNYLDYGSDVRFVGLLESKLASSHMFQFTLPLIFCTSNGKKLAWWKNAIIFGSFIATLSSYSRIGIITCSAVMLGYFIAYIQQSILTRRQKQTLILILILGATVFLILNNSYITYIINKLYYAREGSTNTRIGIYTESISTVLNDSPILGIGIKSIGNRGYPLGSHSTYIGLLYKSGILGSLLFGFGFIAILRNIHKNQKGSAFSFEIICMILPYFIFAIFSDMDGSDWFLVGTMSMWGLYSNRITNNISKNCNQ